MNSSTLTKSNDAMYAMYRSSLKPYYPCQKLKVKTFLWKNDPENTSSQLEHLYKRRIIEILFESESIELKVHTWQSLHEVSSWSGNSQEPTKRGRAPKKNFVNIIFLSLFDIISIAINLVITTNTISTTISTVIKITLAKSTPSPAVRLSWPWGICSPPKQL